MIEVRFDSKAAQTAFDAKGAVYPGIEEFASMTQAMLRPMRIGFVGRNECHYYLRPGSAL